MNNEFVYTYRHTYTPMIYYKVHKDSNRSFCVEIEDTNFETDINHFMNMQRKEITIKDNCYKNPVFSYFERPSIPFTVNDFYNTVSFGRMAYFLVFDLTNESTFEYVKSIYIKMASVYNQFYILRPYIAIVGNKYDLVDEDCNLIREAEKFSNENFIQLWLTSAYIGTNVKKLFVHMVNMVYSNTNLWKYDIDESNSESSRSE